MECTSEQPLRVLAIDPTSGGFAYVILEGPEHLVRWGVKTARHNTNAACLEQIAALVSRYDPDFIVIQDTTKEGVRRSYRVKRLMRNIEKLSTQMEMCFARISHSRLKEFFAQTDAKTKQQIAVAIAKRLPELYYRLPRPRREDSRMSIFDAAALALTFYDSQEEWLTTLS